MLKRTKNTFKVERKCDPTVDTSWYECMLSPFKTFEEAVQYIEKYRNYYPFEYQNYKITYET
jgi:hypothetical protein